MNFPDSNPIPWRSLTYAERTARILWRDGAIGHNPDKPVKFASGFVSEIYCDNRKLIGVVRGRRSITSYLARSCRQADVVVGVATGGMPWAAWVAEILEKPYGYVTDKEIVGEVARRRVVLLEDTVSTGGSVFAKLALFEEAGATVYRCVSIFSWGFPQADAGFQEAGVEFKPLARGVEVLRIGEEDRYLTNVDRRRIEQAFGWPTENR